LTPLKHACLETCRSPLSFLMGLWRPGTAGALRLGLAHGAYCIGCCWALMLLLFVGGVMNLAWIGGLALLVLAEKLAPARLAVTPAVGAMLILAGVVLLVRG
jgi:predicted metal-binding membrane protein